MPVLARLYRVALLSFPAGFRRRFSEHMIDTFEQFCAEEGRLAGLRAIVEAAVQGLQERSTRMFNAMTSRPRNSMRKSRQLTRPGSFVRLGATFKDTRFALRSFRRSPTFTITALIILTVGIGASTAIFSVLDALVISSLPFPDAHRLVQITETYQPETGPLETRAASYPDFRDWRDNTTAFSDIGIRDFQNVSLTLGGREPTLLGAAFVSPSFFRMLGVTPAVGRLLDDGDDVRGNLVAVIGHDLWASRWGMDSSVIGSRMTLNDRTVTIVGVAQPEFDGTYGGLNLWLPFHAEGELIQHRAYERVQRRGLRGFVVVARLDDRVTINEAQRQIDLVTADLHQSGVLPVSRGARVESFEELNLGDARGLVGVLALAVGLVLLIACANVANLLLARQLGRTREMALRRAIGADRSVIVRQLLVESVILGALGGVGGVLLATWLTDIVGSTIVSSVPSYVAPGVDGTALGFAFGLSLITGIAFGMVPALNARKVSISDALRAIPRSDASEGTRGFGARRVLVIGQVAVAIPLLVGSGLMIQSISNALQIETGFEPAGVAVASVNLPVARYDAADWITFADQLRRGLVQRAGVGSVTVASDIPLNAGYSATNVDLSDPRHAGQGYRVYIHRVSPGYFETLHIPVLQGRAFEETDRADARPVVVISQQMAERFWPGTSPLGQLVDSAVVVGVVANATYRSLIPNQEVFPNDPDVFFPFAQSPTARLQMAARGELTPLELTELIRAEVRSLDATLPVFGATTLTEIVETQVAGRRAATAQLGAFAVIALLLAVGGLFGVMVYAVGRQTGEIGLRMAMGATPRRILTMFLAQAAGLVTIGILVGIGLSTAIVRLLESQLYGVATTDVGMYLAAGIAFLLVGLLACTIPAYRATRIDPLVALRGE